MANVYKVAITQKTAVLLDSVLLAENLGNSSADWVIYTALSRWGNVDKQAFPDRPKPKLSMELPGKTRLDRVELAVTTMLDWDDMNPGARAWRWLTATEIAAEIGWPEEQVTRSIVTRIGYAIRTRNGGLSKRSSTDRLLWCPPLADSASEDAQEPAQPLPDTLAPGEI